MDIRATGYEWDKSSPLFKLMSLDPPTFSGQKGSLSYHPLGMIFKAVSVKYIHFVTERMLKSMKFHTMVSLLSNPIHFFTGRGAKSMKIHTKFLLLLCQFHAVRSQKANYKTPLMIQKDALLMLPNGGERHGGRLESLWLGQYFLTCSLPQQIIINAGCMNQ